MSTQHLRLISYTPLHVSRRWTHNSSFTEKCRKRGFDIFFVCNDGCRDVFKIEKIDFADEWSKDFGYNIPQLKTDLEAIEIARTIFKLPVNDNGIVTDFK